MRLRLQGRSIQRFAVFTAGRRRGAEGEQVAEEIVLAMRMNVGARKRNERTKK